MTPELETICRELDVPVFRSKLESECREDGEKILLMKAFQMFTQASSSLETAFTQLQEKARRLTEELEAKNLELEQSLREKQEVQNYLNTILERLPCGVFVQDGRGDLTLCNPMASEVLSLPRCIPPGCSDSNLSVLGAEFRDCIAASVSPDAANVEMEIPYETREGKKILATSGAPLVDEDGHRTGTLHIIRDVTEMKALQEKNKRVERLSAMGEMAVELAHEIRNPLGSMELFASLLARESTGDSQRWAENISTGIRSLNTIVSNMLHFANPITPVFSDVDVHEIILEIQKFCEPIMSQRQVNLTMELRAKRSLLQADGELIKQMMFNLVFNAMKAMPRRGALNVRTRNIAAVSGEPFNALELQVEDTGLGIPAENLERIFDPFFTTNKNGTGLGLSIVHQIVKRHSGTIRVKSELNRGTIFTIVFDLEPKKE
jgi:signal transduction histidine kinase